MIRVCLVLEEKSTYLPKVAVPPAVSESYYSTSLPAFGIVSVLDFGCFNRYLMVINNHFRNSWNYSLVDFYVKKCAVKEK